MELQHSHIIFIDMKRIIFITALTIALGLISCYVEPNGYVTVHDDYYYSPYPYNPYRYYDVPFSYRIYSVPKTIVVRPPRNTPPPARQNSLYPQYSPRKSYDNVPRTAPIRTFPGRGH